MASIAKLVVSLGANTADFETDMQRAAGVSKRQLAKMERDAKRLNDQWNRNFRMAGAAVAAGMVIATKAAIDFESAMAEVGTLGAGDLDLLSDSVKRLSMEFGQAPVDQAKALYQIISAGAETSADQIEILTAANKLAVGGLTDVATAADGLTTTLNAYSLKASDAQRVSDVFFNTMKQGKTTIPEINAAIGNVATIASQAGVSLEELGAATALVTKQGQDTSRSMDGLRGVLSAVLKQSEQTKKAATEIGIQFDLARLKSVGLAGVLQDIADSGATADQLSKLVGRVEGLTNALSLVKDGGRAFAEELRLIQSGIGATDDAVAVITKSTKFLMQQLSSAVSVAAINFGEKLLPAVQNVSRFMITSFETVIAVIETLVAVLVTRLAVAGVAALNAAAAATSRLAVAMAIVGGWPGLIAAGIAILITNWDRLRKSAGLVGETFTQLTRGFIILKGVLLAIIDTFKALALAAAATVNLVLAPVKAMVSGLAKARTALLSGDLAGASDAIGSILAESAKNSSKALGELAEAGRIAAGAGKHMTDAWQESLDVLDDAESGIRSLEQAMTAAASRIKKAQDQIEEANKWLDELGKSGGRAAGSTQSLKDAIKASEQPLKNANKLFKEASGLLDEIGQEIDQFGNIADRLYPMEEATRNFHSELAILRTYSDEAGWSAERLAEAEVKLANEFAKTTQGISGQKQAFDLFATAIDEGVRILERSFTTMWDNLLSSSGKVFDGVLDGFKSLLANMIHQATTQKIALNIQQGLQPGGQINYGQLAGDLGQFAAIIAGTSIGGGGVGAGLGAAAGGIALGSVGAAFGTLFGGPAGAVAGKIIGSLLGSAIGGLLGGLFDSKREPVLQVSSFDTSGLSGSDDDALVNSIFGKTFLRSRRIEAEAIAEVSASIKEFDSAIGEFIDDDQIGAIATALQGWNQRMEGDAISIEQLLASRFATIMTTFSDGIRNFVNDGEDLEAKFARLQIGTGAEKVIAAAPELFGSRDINDFLAVVSAFKTGSKTITEAFTEVVAMLEQVGAVLGSLQEYADSDLAAEYQALVDTANISLADAVTGMQSALMDAIAAFDGSPEQLAQIGQIALAVREGELKLLAEIDSIQQGISANLAQLTKDLLGLTAEPKTGEQLFNEAADLIASLSTATSAQEVAAIATQFEALIRQMSPEDQTRNQSELLRMVADFDSAQQDVLGALKQTAMDNANAMRDMVDVFLTDIGPPLDIVANSNQQAAEALSTISTVDMQGHLDNTEEILQVGMDGITDEVGKLGPAIASAIRQGFGGAEVNVSVLLPGGGAVNE